jgi:uncharacterized protein YcbK (DUF882 family)
MTLGPSPHLYWSELACHDSAKTPYPEEWRATRGKVLARTFERIRSTLGEHTGTLRPLEIGSGYRTKEHNKKIGGAADSMHLYGLAIDLHTPSGVSLEQLHRAAAEVLGQRGGLFIYDWGVHVDRRDYLKREMARGDYRKGIK